MRIGFGRRTQRPSETYLLGDEFLLGEPTPIPWLASIAAHGLLLAFVPTLAQSLFISNNPQPAPTTYHVEMIHLQVPDTLYFQAVHSHKEARDPAENPAPASTSQQAQRDAVAAPRPQVSIPNSMELPVTRHRPNETAIILQPDETTPAPPMTAAPPMAFWTKTSPPPPPRRQAVIPGRVQRPLVTPKLDAPPVLSPSNAQPVAADLAVALAAAQAPPKLPLPNSSTNPVRMRGQDGAEIASFEVPQSDPLNLINLAANRSVPKDIEIPKGLQNTPLSNGGGGSEMTAGRSPENRERSARGAGAQPGPADPARGNDPAKGGAAAVPQAAGVAPVKAGVAANSPSNSPAAGRGQPESMATARAPRDNPAAAADGAVHAPAPAGASAPETVQNPVQNGNAAVIRMTHPSNGNFDVVILQSVARDDLPDVGGTLSGNPVYTVYLKVGDEREWLLEYCIPASVNSHASTYQVNIDDSGVVSAPYPLSTVIPRDVVELPHPRHIVLHGLLSASGVFRNVVGLDSENPLVREVLPLLSQWQFRPALRDRVPVEVEILLIIPARS